MSKRAVLVGINYADAPEDCPPLSGCVNDVWMLHERLLSKFGFVEEDITILIDSENEGTYSLPTGRNILNAMNEAVDASEDGDVLVFAYSGHGSQQDDEGGEEEDGQDEFLVAVDAVPITDDMLQTLVSRLPRGVLFTFISDCCHSGSMLDQPTQDVEITGRKTASEVEEYADGVDAAEDEGADEDGEEDPDYVDEDEEGADEDEDDYADEDEDDEEEAYGKHSKKRHGSRAVPRQLSTQQLLGFMSKVHSTPLQFMADNHLLPEEEAAGGNQEPGHPWLSRLFKSSKTRKLQRGRPTLPDHCVLISGCMDHQTSDDAEFDGRANGALTYSLVTVLDSFDGAPTYREVVRSARGFLKESGHDQNPTLSCGEGIADLPFICEVDE